MAQLVSYLIGQELPDLALRWEDSNGNLIDFSSGYTFTVKVGNLGESASLTKTTGISGSATSPNVTIAWSTTELSALPAGDYVLQVIARRTSDSKDRLFGDPLDMPRIRIVSAVS